MVVDSQLEVDECFIWFSLIIYYQGPLFLQWLCGGKRHQGIVSLKIEDGNEVNNMFGSDDEFTTQIPSQAQTLSEGSSSVLVSEYKPSPDVDYLQVCLSSLLLTHLLPVLS